MKLESEECAVARAPRSDAGRLIIVSIRSSLSASLGIASGLPRKTRRCLFESCRSAALEPLLVRQPYLKLDPYR